MTPRSENPREEGPWGWQARDAAAQAGQLGTNHYAVYCALTHFQSAAASDHKRRFAASYEQLAEYLKERMGKEEYWATLQRAGAQKLSEALGLFEEFEQTRGGYYVKIAGS